MATTTVPSTPTSFPTGRLAGLDALRGGAMLLGVLLHAAMAYMPTRIRHMLWPVMDEPTSVICDVVYWGAHTFRLPLFFFLSGFFAEQVYQTRGVRTFVDQRVKRLAVPYAVSLITILPLVFAVWSTGWLIAERCTLEQVLSPLVPFEPELQANYFNPAHLWFLIDLMVFNAAYLGLRLEWPGESNIEQSRRLWQHGSWFTPIILAAPAAMLLWGNSSPVTEFHNSFLPDASRLLYYGLYFSVGTQAYRNRDAFHVATHRWSMFLIGAIAAVTISLLLVRAEVTQSGNLWSRCVFAWSVALAAWLTILGGIGAVVRHVRGDWPRVRYLADSSFWMFLIHFPIVGLSHIALRSLAIEPTLKMLASFGITLFIGLGSYKVFVRHSIIGEFLHGRRDRTVVSEAAPAATPIELRSAA